MKRMMILAGAAVALMAMAEPALSQPRTIVTETCRGDTCTTIFERNTLRPPDARIIHIPQTSDFGSESPEAWDQRCQPQRYLQPSTGLWRMMYAHANCGGDTTPRN